VYVGVAATNTRALTFYRRVQFVDLGSTGGALWLGRRLSQPGSS
jgi:ribosomal protein S18 acetylase RimI-like enzyme